MGEKISSATTVNFDKLVINKNIEGNGNVVHITKIRPTETIDLDTNNSTEEYKLGTYFNIEEYTGGYQGSLVDNFTKYKNDETIQKIIKNYFPDETLDEGTLALLFYRIKYSGCGYVSFANMIFDATKDMSDKDFEKYFGFPRYQTVTVDNGKQQEICNYDYMVLDYFLSCSMQDDPKNLQDIYGNVYEQMVYYGDVKDGSLSSGESFKATGNAGIRVGRFRETQDFLKSKGIDYSILNSEIYCDSGYENSETIKNIKELDADKIAKLLDEGKQIELGDSNFNLYYSNGDIAYEDVGGHSMVVTGVTEDGMLKVSSWGEEFLYDLSNEPTDICINDFKVAF